MPSNEEQLEHVRRVLEQTRQISESAPRHSAIIHDMLDVPSEARLRPINPAASEEVLGITAEENERRREAAEEAATAHSRVLYSGSRSGRTHFAMPYGRTWESVAEHGQAIGRANRITWPEDFRSNLDYTLFLKSKYKHHHKCEGDGCGVVFRCGNRKCTVTKCFVCLNGVRFTTQDVITARAALNERLNMIPEDEVEVRIGDDGQILPVD